MKKNLKLLVLAHFLCFFTSTGFSQESDNSALIKKIKPSVVFLSKYGKENALVATGTGFFIEPNKILTNYHMIDGASRVEIRTVGGQTYEIKGVVAEDDDADIAKLELSFSSENFLSLQSSTDKIEEGNRIIVIGNPKGIEFISSEGIISSLRQQNIGRFSHNAPVTHGSSGSPIVNTKGELVGIITSGFEGSGDLNFGTLVSSIKKLVDHKLQIFSDWKESEEQKLLSTPEGLMKKSEKEYRKNNYEWSIYYAEQALTKRPKFADAWYWIAYGNYQLGNYDHAVHCINHAVDIDSTNSGYLASLGDFLYSSKRYQEAIITYKRIIFLEPDFLSVYIKLAKTLSTAGRSKEGISILEKALEIKPKYSDAFYTMCGIYKDIGEYSSAIEAANRCLAIDPDYSSAFVRLGLCYEAQDKNSEAIDAYEHALRISPDYYYAKYCLGKCYYYQSQYEMSIPCLQWCKEKDSTDALPAYYLGLSYRALGKKESALQFFKDANYCDAKSYQPLLQLSIAEMEVGDYKNALPNFRRAIKLDPNNVSAYTNLSSLFIKTEDINQAIEIAREAYQIAPDDYNVLKSLAEAYYINGEYSSAMEYSEKGESLFPKDANIVFLVGKCAVASKNKNLALAKCDVLKKLENKRLADDLFALIYKN